MAEFGKNVTYCGAQVIKQQNNLHLSHSPVALCSYLYVGHFFTGLPFYNWVTPNSRSATSVLTLRHYLKAQCNHSSSGSEKLPTGAGLGTGTLPSIVKAVISHCFLCDSQQKLTPRQIFQVQQVWFEICAQRGNELAIAEVLLL